MAWNIFKKGKDKLQNQEGIDFKTKIENALRNAENDKRDAEAEILDGSIMGIEEASRVSKPCRICEFACPVAQGTSR